MSGRLAFQTQLASIMEVLANAAVAEICKLVDDDYAVVSLQMTQCQRENKALKRKLHLLELKLARGNAERRLRDSAANSGGNGRFRGHIGGGERFRETAASTGGVFDPQVDVGSWSAKDDATDCTSNQPIHSDGTLSKSPDVELVENKRLVKEESIDASKVVEPEEDVPLIGDDGVLEIVHRGASGHSVRPGQQDSQSQINRARPPSGSSRGVEIAVGPDVMMVKVEDMETRAATQNQSALSIQEVWHKEEQEETKVERQSAARLNFRKTKGLVESSTDDYVGGLLIDDGSQPSLSDLHEPGGGFTESSPRISEETLRIRTVQHVLAEDNQQTKSNTHPPIKITSICSGGSTLSSDYSMFELETFFTRWAPDSGSGPASGGPSCVDDSSECDMDVTIVETEPSPTRMGWSPATHIQPSLTQGASMSSQRSWNKAGVVRKMQELQQKPPSHVDAKNTLSDSGSRNNDTSNILGVRSSSRARRSTIASQPSSPVPVVLAGTDVNKATQQQAHFLVQKRQEPGIIHSEGRRKSFICRICGKAFPGQSNLEAHRRVHTGEKPYRCDTCGKHFSEAGNLKKHQRVHTGEKPFSCNQCGKTFAWICNLRTHQQSATGCNPQIGWSGGVG